VTQALNTPAAEVRDETLSDFERLLQKDLRPVNSTERFLAQRTNYWWLAMRFQASGFFAKKFRTVDAIFSAMLYGARFGWDPWTSLQNCYDVKGTIGQSAASMLAIAIGAGATVHVKESGRGGTPGAVGDWCEVTLTRPDHDPVIKRWDQADVARAGLAYNYQSGEPNMHKKFPAQMLQWRAVADACRLQFADKLCGVLATEELSDQFANIPENHVGELAPEKKRSLKDLPEPPKPSANPLQAPPPPQDRGTESAAVADLQRIADEANTKLPHELKTSPVSTPAQGGADTPPGPAPTGGQTMAADVPAGNTGNGVHAPISSSAAPLITAPETGPGAENASAGPFPAAVPMAGAAPTRPAPATKTTRPSARRDTGGADAPNGNAGVKCSEPAAMPVPTDKLTTSAPSSDNAPLVVGAPAVEPPAPTTPKRTKAQKAAHVSALEWAQKTPVEQLEMKLRGASIGNPRQKENFAHAKEECQYSGTVTQADEAMKRALAYWFAYFDLTTPRA
jgi:hypothetical protein